MNTETLQAANEGIPSDAPGHELERYMIDYLSLNVLDHSLRVSRVRDKVSFLIHPLGVDESPSEFIVTGNKTTRRGSSHGIEWALQQMMAGHYVQHDNDPAIRFALENVYPCFVRKDEDGSEVIHAFTAGDVLAKNWELAE
jgi:hypothetical protein